MKQFTILKLALGAVLLCSTQLVDAYLIRLINTTDYTMDVTLSYEGELICKTELFKLDKHETKEIQVGACCVKLYKIDNIFGPQRFDGKTLTFERKLHVHGVTCGDQTLTISLTN